MTEYFSSVGQCDSFGRGFFEHHDAGQFIPEEIIQAVKIDCPGKKICYARLVFFILENLKKAR
jgi:hypothetical protein